MTMQRRHFELLARTVADLANPADRTRMAHHFADALRHTNANFDRARFLKACGAAETYESIARPHAPTAREQNDATQRALDTLRATARF